MCAIAGVIDLKHDLTIHKAMMNTMMRRGPDDNGIQVLDRGCLLHTRLAVIDPECGKQPMTLEWAGETYTIVYNGELYNTQEIRKRLTSLGHTFLGRSDTEVLLHAYAQWKKECLENMNGIYAFAVWEHKQGRLFIARDRMGVKPLFYTVKNNGLIFGSEIKTILAHPEVPAELGADGVAQLLLIGPGRIPGSGVFRNILELKPGHCGLFENGKMHTAPYWSLKDREHRESFEETTDHVRWLLTDSILRQTVSDVPIGAFLSGGLDSSIISSLYSKQMSISGKPAHTFSLDYKDNNLYFVPGKFQPNSDTSYIQIMQKQLDSQQHWTVLTPDDLIQSMAAATYARDLPGMADVDFSLLSFCGDIRKEVKVALSGECADEIFGGYPWYRDPEVLSKNGFPWAQNTAYRASFLNPYYANQLDSEDYVQTLYQDTVEQCDILPDTPVQERRVKQMINLNQQWFMQTLLERKDRMSMYHGLEVRVPFCDHRIAEYLYGVPWEYKDYKGFEKGLLRNAMTDLLPEEILWRKKSPYPKTHDPRYSQLVSAQLVKLLQENDAPIFQIVNRNALERLLQQDDPWPWYGQLMRRPQTIAYMLQINIWLEQYKIQLV